MLYRNHAHIQVIRDLINNFWQNFKDIIKLNWSVEGFLERCHRWIVWFNTNLLL